LTYLQREKRNKNVNEGKKLKNKKETSFQRNNLKALM